jgi:hypothetical protein
VSHCCLTTTQQFSSYIMARTSLFSMRWWWDPTCTRLSWIIIVLPHWNNSLRVDMSPGWTHYPDSEQPVFVLSIWCCVFRGEATNTNFIVFGLIRLGLEPTIYHTRGEHASHYNTDAVVIYWREHSTSLQAKYHGDKKKWHWRLYIG